MAIRRLIRGTVPEHELEAIAREALDRQGHTFESLRLLESDNWLSTPAVINDQYFLKVVSRRNTIVQGLLTASRNLGAYASGTEAFFERFDSPLEMAEHELAATVRMRELGVNAPEPVEAFEYGTYGVVVLEYLPDFETLDTVDTELARKLAPALFEALTTMHEAGLVHGDLRSDNVLIADEELYFIDATNVNGAALDEARAYDVACALAALEPRIGASEAVRAAADHCPGDVLLAAEQFLDVVNLRPDHDFVAVELTGEIDKTVRST